MYPYSGDSVLTFQPGHEKEVKELFKDVLHWLEQDSAFDLAFLSPYEHHLYLVDEATTGFRGAHIIKCENPNYLSNLLAFQFRNFGAVVLESTLPNSKIVEIPKLLGFKLLLVKVGQEE